MKVFSQTITCLYQKCSHEFDSISQTLSGKCLKYQIRLPTDIKKMGGILVVLMSFLQQLIIKGHFIDHNYLKVMVQHIVKQETSKSSNVEFGYR